MAHGQLTPRPRCCSTSSERDRHHHPQPAVGPQRPVERAAGAAAAGDARGRRGGRRRRDHPHRGRPGVLRRARPQGARLVGRQPRRRQRQRRQPQHHRHPRPVPEADQAADRGDQRRRHHRRVRAGPQLRLPHRLRAGQVRRHPQPRRRDARVGPDRAAAAGDRGATGARDVVHRQLHVAPRKRCSSGSSTTSSPTTTCCRSPGRSPPTSSATTSPACARSAPPTPPSPTTTTAGSRRHGTRGCGSARCSARTRLPSGEPPSRLAARPSDDPARPALASTPRPRREILPLRDGRPEIAC